MPTLSVRSLGAWLQTHGGVPTSRMKMSGSFSCMIVCSQAATCISAAARRIIPDRMDLDAAVMKFHSGADTHYGWGLTAGLTWHFLTGGAPIASADRLRRP
jgi:hypothetical protein